MCVTLRCVPALALDDSSTTQYVQRSVTSRENLSYCSQRVSEKTLSSANLNATIICPDRTATKHNGHQGPQEGLRQHKEGSRALRAPHFVFKANKSIECILNGLTTEVPNKILFPAIFIPPLFGLLPFMKRCFLI